jgi:DhnA family fructose-bisphosphate aldolase class Ia
LITTLSADLTGQANHLGVTIEADIIKQKQPTNNGGYHAINFGKTHPAGGREADHRQPDRPDALPGGWLLHGSGSA